MKLISTIAEWRQIYNNLKETNPRVKIGLVPTMGYLHGGHISLVNEARKDCDVVVMSIFVNPLQFGENEDFDRYPRDLERDKSLAEFHRVDYLFVPETREMYPEPPRTSIKVSLSEAMCGKFRPGHFDGVALVVTKLFNIIQPDYAYFGQKDAQQVAIIEQLVKDLNLPVTIKQCPTIREPDGLAMSSRNVYLSPEERKQAVWLYKSLQSARTLIEEGERDAAIIKNYIAQLLSSQPDIRLEYVEIRSFPGLEELHRLKGRVIVALAAHLGKTRLIDNVILSLKEG
jgi:pantoate--beta-alanine ligase